MSELNSRISKCSEWYRGIDFSFIKDEKKFQTFASKSVVLHRDAATRQSVINVKRAQTASVNLSATPVPEVIIPDWAFSLSQVSEIIEKMYGAEVAEKLTDAEKAMVALIFVNGFFIHEGLHIRLSPSKFSGLFTEKLFNKSTIAIAMNFLINVMEDFFIERNFEYNGNQSKLFIELLDTLVQHEVDASLANFVKVLEETGSYPIMEDEDLNNLRMFLGGIIVCRYDSKFNKVYEKIGLMELIDEIEEIAKNTKGISRVMMMDARRNVFDKVLTLVEKTFPVFIPDSDDSSDGDSSGSDSDGDSSGSDSGMKSDVDFDSVGKDSKSGTKMDIDEVKELIDSLKETSSVEIEIEIEAADREVGGEVKSKSDIIESRHKIYYGYDLGDGMIIRDIDEIFSSYSPDRIFKGLDDFSGDLINEVIQIRQNDLVPGMAMNSGSNIVMSRIHRIATDNKIFAPKVRMGNAKKSKDMPEVGLICDFSGSVDAALAISELQATYVMFRILTDLEVPTKVFAHSSKRSYASGKDCPVIYKIVDNQIPEQVEDMDNRFIKAMGINRSQNYDGFVLKKVAEELLDTDRAKMIMHFSDGMPSGINYGAYEYGIFHTKSVIKELEENGVIVMGVSVKGEVVEQNQNIYEENHVDASFGLEDLAIEIHQVLQTV